MFKLKKTMFGVAVAAFAGVAFAATSTGSGQIKAEASAQAEAFAIPGDLTLSSTNENIVCSAGGVRVEGDGKVGYFKTGTSVTFNNVECTRPGTYKMTIPVDWSVGDAKFQVDITDVASGNVEATVTEIMPKNSGKQSFSFDLEGTVYAGTKSVVISSVDNPSHANGFNWFTPTFEWTGVGEAGGGEEIYTDLEAIAIPTPKGEFIDLKKSSFDGTNGKVENGGVNVGSTREGTTLVLKFISEKSANYTLSFFTGHKGTALIDVTLMDKYGNALLTKQHTASNTGSWSLTTPFEAETGILPAGTYILKLYAHDLKDNNYAGNWGNFSMREIVEDLDEFGGPLDWDHIPGEIVIDNWSYSGARLEGGTPASNVGYVKNGTFAKTKFFCRETGVYKLAINFTSMADGGEIQPVIIDRESGEVEADAAYKVDKATGVQEFVIEGTITKGKKDIQLNFLSNTSGFLFNYKEPVFTKIGEKFAKINGLTFADGKAVEMEGYDWNFNLPLEYSKETVTVALGHENGKIAASMDGATVTDNGDGTFTFPTPAPSTEAIVKFTLTPDEGAMSNQTVYTLRIFHIGDIILTDLDIAGLHADEATVKRFNDNESNIAIDGYVFTAIPAVKATFVDASTAEGTVTLNDAKTEATVTFTGKAGSVSKDFTFTLPGFHIYTPAENDKETKLTYDSGAKGSEKWDNGLYSFTCNDGWDGKQFKMKGNTTHTLTVPTDMRIKQLRLCGLGDNYSSGRIAEVKSEGATVWTPSAAFFTTGDAARYDLIINIENHIPGTPFDITIEGGSQPVFWFEFVYETVTPQDAPVCVATNATSVADRNHAVVTFRFNRAMADATITVNGTEVTAYGGGASLSFSVWDLPYGTATDVTIPAGAAKDAYGNATDKAYTLKLNVGEKAAVKPLDPSRFTVVETVGELRAAVAALANTNNTADAEWSYIYILNGDYNLGSDALVLGKVYNVAFIGESQDGVLIHGTKAGISDPTFSTRNSSMVYMENFTSRNDLDFGKAERAGVGVAHYGGGKDIMKNVTLQSIQDTQVTGERGYYYNVTIHGSVDYICGGGDHFYDACLIKHEIAGGYITAPSTSASNKHGYVFQGCTIDGVGPYDLGRPWQNEPRCFWLNTTMKIQPNPAGWGKMSSLPTHFFEYNSMDADGKAIDLSTRKNSPTSTNTYSPILPDEYADYFTARNVLGGKDSWDAAEMVAECEAPAKVYFLPNSTDFTWEAVEGAAAYLIFADGKFAGMTTDCQYSPELTARATPAYTVAAINANGARGAVSAAATNPTGVDATIAADDESAEYFNLQGIAVGSDAKGTLIRVTRDGKGHTSAQKVIIR